MMKPGINQTLKCEPLVKVAEQLRKTLVCMSSADPAHGSVKAALVSVWKAIEIADPIYAKVVKEALGFAKTNVVHLDPYASAAPKKRVRA